MQVLLEKSHFFRILNKFFVVSCAGKQIQNRLHGIVRLHSVQSFANIVHRLLLVRIQKQILPSGTGLRNVDCRKYPLLRHLAVKHQFHVSGTGA